MDRRPVEFSIVHFIVDDRPALSMHITIINRFRLGGSTDQPKNDHYEGSPVTLGPYVRIVTGSGLLIGQISS